MLKLYVVGLGFIFSGNLFDMEKLGNKKKKFEDKFSGFKFKKIKKFLVILEEMSVFGEDF